MRVLRMMVVVRTSVAAKARASPVVAASQLRLLAKKRRLSSQLLPRTITTAETRAVAETEETVDAAVVEAVTTAEVVAVVARVAELPLLTKTQPHTTPSLTRPERVLSHLLAAKVAVGAVEALAEVIVVVIAVVMATTEVMAVVSPVVLAVADARVAVEVVVAARAVALPQLKATTNESDRWQITEAKCNDEVAEMN